MNVKKNLLFAAVLTFLLGACSPYYYPPHPNQPSVNTQPTRTQMLTPEQQRLLAESQNASISQPEINGVVTPANPQLSGVAASVAPTIKKRNYPTASRVPGKPGFVFNPYTHNIVDVKGIGSGKLCRDPEDADVTHKFRVP